MENSHEQSFFNQLKTDENLKSFIQLIGQSIHRQISLPADVFEIIEKFVCDLDQQLSVQLNEIIHHSDLQALESAWRSLHFLVSNTNANYWLKIRMMQLTKKELHRDFERSLKFDQSIIFKKIHDDEYGAFGGTPYNAIIGNYEFDLSPPDMLILENFAKVSAECYAPFLSSASIEAINTTPQNLQWQSFRRKYEATFISLCTPQILLRNVYADKHEFDKTILAESFSFTEKISSKDDYLWGNPAFALGVKLTERFHQYKWGALIEGEENGIIFADIPKIKVSHPKEFHHIVHNSLKMIWDSDEEAKLRDEGFTVVSNYLNTIRILSANSCAEPLQAGNESENLEFKQFSALPRVFTAGRFVHHLKKWF